MATKKFRFRLESLLKIRKHREKERQKEHALAMGKVSEQKAQLGQMDRQRLATLDHQRSKLLGSISVAETLVCSRYLQQIKRHRIAGTELLHGLEKEAEQRRVKLVEASRQRKIFDLLKEKQQLRHYQQLDKLDQKETDEVAVSLFRRNKRKKR